MKLRIDKKYGQAPNELLNFDKLSFKAKGIFTYLQSKPDGWDFCADRIQKDSKDGRDSILNGLKELEKYGYLVRSKFKNDKGQWEWEHILYENPILENPESENPTTEKSTTNKTRNTKQEKERKNNNIDQKEKEFEEWWKEYPNKKAKQKAKVIFMSIINKVGIEKLIQSVKDYKNESEWKKKEGKFFPEFKHPATWLNQQCWNDEYDTKYKSDIQNIPKIDMVEYTKNNPTF